MHAQSAKTYGTQSAKTMERRTRDADGLEGHAVRQAQNHHRALGFGAILAAG